VSTLLSLLSRVLKLATRVSVESEEEVTGAENNDLRYFECGLQYIFPPLAGIQTFALFRVMLHKMQFMNYYIYDSHKE